MDRKSARRGAGGVLVDEIESSLRKFVRIEDIQETYGYPSDDNSDDDDDAEESEELEPYGPELGKRVEAVPCSEEDDPEAALQLLFSEGSTQPSEPLVSAIKGTREKLGASSRTLTVNWAPDVYDPIPNALSHAVKTKQKKSRKDKDKEKDNHTNYKKNGKKGQKGYSKGGAGGKDKKQSRKTGGRSEKSYRSVNACDGLDSSDEFDVGNPDYCGSSFMKKSASNFHYVAEAL